MNHDVHTLERLKNVDLFATLSDRNLKRVIDSGRPVTHRAGHQVVSEGGGSVGFHLIMQGSAQVDVAGTDRPSLGVGDYFGEIALLDGKPRTATISAGPDGLVTFSITSYDFSDLLDKHPEMNKPIIEVLCARLREERARLHAHQA